MLSLVNRTCRTTEHFSCNVPISKSLPKCLPDSCLGSSQSDIGELKIRCPTTRKLTHLFFLPRLDCLQSVVILGLLTSYMKATSPLDEKISSHLRTLNSQLRYLTLLYNNGHFDSLADLASGEEDSLDFRGAIQ